MPHDVVATCPVCSGELAVTRLHCRSCGTTLEGDFNVGRFGRLSREQMAILDSFLRSRGNLRDMERELGLSYPTVRARVEALIRALGFGPRADSDEAVADAETAAADAAAAVAAAGAAMQDVAAARQEILERLARREIDADTAATAIRSLGRSRS
ncbi:MAG TPA: DUF2089 domain-containing protein [Candidatus Acidoferrales bacterium]|jgi:hypothetical protein|nr:DUF2089 domain-containing protein [Candidatus Acidoferrales bacterium]